MVGGFYETAKALSEYLLFHYGKPEEVLPWDFGPSDALDYPARCVSECVAADRLAANARALDLGCAVGRSTFELARHCAEVIPASTCPKTSLPLAGATPARRPS